MIFVEKDKQPKLSDELQKVIERSHGDQKNNAAMDDVVRLKHKVIRELTSNADVLRALHNHNIESKILNWDNPNGDMYRDINIFDYMKLPSLKDEVFNYICFEVNSTNSYSNDFITINLYFRTVCHVSDMKTDWGIQRF